MQYYVPKFLEYDRFYAMCDSVDRQVEVMDDSEDCPLCKRRPYVYRWTAPYKIVLSKPLFGDMMFAESCELIVSQAFREAYEKEHLTGIVEFCPLEEVRVKRNTKKQLIPPTYYYAKTIRALATYDMEKTVYEKTHMNTENLCPICSPTGYNMQYDTFYGFDIKFLDQSQKDLDILRIYPIRWREIFSQRVWDMAEKYGLKNITNKLIPTQEYLILPATKFSENCKRVEEEIKQRLRNGLEY